MSNEVFINRICACCKNELHISHDNIKEVIYYDKASYHSKCFRDMCKKRSESARSNISEKWTKILEDITDIEHQSYSHFANAIAREEVFEFVKDAYDITIVPTTIWHKLSSIYNGTFKGMDHGIPPEHLLDMWRRKMKMLNDIAYNNKRKGKILTSQQRLSYDLSILVNKYDSYLKWLERQKILEAEKNTASKEIPLATSIDYNALFQSVKQDKDDISGLVDDIFE